MGNYWYNPRKLLSHNRFMNFVMSHRGGGKTYAGKKIAIDNFIKNKKQFMYIRRYKTELKNISKFFNDIKQEYPSLKFEVKGNTFYINEKICGYAVSLTQQVQIRSTPYPDVTFILFDEFVLDPKKTLRYLNDEVTTFLEIISTVVRNRNDLKVLCCANSISYVNPYFEYWNIRINPNDTQAFYKAPKNKQVVVELFESHEFRMMMEETLFGELILGTDYGDYAIENKVLLDSDAFIMNKKPKDSKFICSFKYDSSEFGMWFSQKEQIYHFNKQIDPSNKNKYSITKDDHDLNYTTIKFVKNSPMVKSMRLYYDQGLCFFTNQEIKNKMYEIFKYCGI